MGRTLILTDDVGRAERLARNVGGGGNTAIYDLYGDAPVPVGSGLIISDVSAATSDSMLRLQRALAAAREGQTPFLCIVHGNPKRGEIQATVLKATRTLPASMAAAMLMNTVAAMIGPSASPTPQRQRNEAAEAAREAFVTIFRPHKSPPSAVVDVGTAIVNRAIHEAGIREWLDVVARFDDVTHRHCLAVAGLAADFAKTLGFNDRDAHQLTKGAVLHDIGKAQIPLSILNKPAALTPAERREMERHPAFGHAMLLDGAYDATILAVVRSHHEYLDGSGYPDGLRGAEIPDFVRLVTICDIFAAVTEWRPYKAPKPADQAYAILDRMGPKLDADLVRAFGPVAAACGAPPLRVSA